jgi:uncharacterized damage-inducible protein DinB
VDGNAPRAVESETQTQTVSEGQTREQQMLDEVARYIESIARVRGKILETIAGLDAGALDWTPSPEETNSLFVIATHCTGSEHGWIYEVLGRGEKTRDRAAEFKARAGDVEGPGENGKAVARLRAEYERVARETETILAARTASDLESTRDVPGRGTVTERWIILHVIEHSSEHLGQMYLTRQLLLEQGGVQAA